MNITSSRWIQEFEKQLYRRQHIVLYGNIDDQLNASKHTQNLALQPF